MARGAVPAAEPRPLRAADVLVSPAGTRWTVTRALRGASLPGFRQIRSEGGAHRWVSAHDVADWHREEIV